MKGKEKEKKIHCASCFLAAIELQRKRKSWNLTGLACWLAEFMSLVKNTNKGKNRR